MDNMTDDTLIDSIEISWVDGVPTKYTTATVPDFPGAGMLRSFLSRSYWTGLLFYAEGVVEHTGRDANDSGFRYGAEDEEDFDGHADADADADDDADDEDEEADDDDEDEDADSECGDADTVAIVHIFNPYETVTMSEPAFVRLMSRLFSTIVDGATAEPNDVVHSDWWPQFVELTAQVQELAEHI